jgi:hypothetical protein
MGSGPFLGGGFGHFYAYAPMKIEYAIDRFAMEVKRQLDVLDKHLAKNEFMAGAKYSIADMAIWPWYGTLMQGKVYNDAATYLDTGIYTNLKRWTDQIAERPAVKRGRMVNKRLWRAFRAAARAPRRLDFELRTQDKLDAAEGRQGLMAKLPEMTKHRGIPSGLPGTGFQFTIRRANPRGVTAIINRRRDGGPDADGKARRCGLPACGVEVHVFQDPDRQPG